jgi:hypothetical protein
MTKRRRKNLVFTVSAIVTLVIAASLSAAAQHPTPSPPQVRQSPNAPTNQNVPQGIDRPQLSPDTSKETVDPQNDREIRAGVQRLYALVTELKSEVDQTNSSMILSTSVVKRAQEIEKLAKQIKDRARK